jgi:putative transposase
MTAKISYKYFKTSPEIIQLAVMYYVRYPLSYRQVEDILSERGVDICHETIRFWVNRFGGAFAKKIGKKRRCNHSNWRWHLDEVFVKINGEKFLLWRAVDHEGEVLEAFVSKKRCKRTALKFIKKLMKKHGNPHEIVTDKLASYGAALNVLGAKHLQNTTQYHNNRCENSHLPFRRRERAMQKFRSAATLQRFAAVYGSIYNHFNHERHLETRRAYKQKRAAALTEWREICAA